MMMMKKIINKTILLTVIGMFYFLSGFAMDPYMEQQQHTKTDPQMQDVWQFFDTTNNDTCTTFQLHQRFWRRRKSTRSGRWRHLGGSRPSTRPHTCKRRLAPVANLGTCVRYDKDNKKP